MMLNPYVAQPIKKRKQKIKSYVTMVIRYMWYVFEFRFKWLDICGKHRFSYIHFTNM